MSELTQAPVSAVSFERPSFPKLTDGQRLLIDLLKRRLSEHKPINKEDIWDLYANACGLEKGTVHWDGVDPITGQTKMRTDWRTLSFNNHWDFARARQWFVSNLGVCILKGRLLALPIIDAD